MKNINKLADYLLGLGGLDAEAPDLSQFLKASYVGSVNVMAEGGLADPLLLDLARQAEIDRAYQDMIESVRLHDKYKDLPLGHHLKQFKSLIQGMFILDIPAGSLLCLQDGHVVVPIAARKHYLTVLHQNHMAGYIMVETAHQ